MTINTRRNGNQVRIIVEGVMDENNSGLFKDWFRRLNNDDIQEIEVDFAGLTRMGSAGFGKILLLYKQITSRGGRLAVINTPAPIHALFTRMQLDTLFSVTTGEIQTRKA